MRIVSGRREGVDIGVLVRGVLVVEEWDKAIAGRCVCAIWAGFGLDGDLRRFREGIGEIDY